MIRPSLLALLLLPAVGSCISPPEPIPAPAPENLGGDVQAQDALQAPGGRHVQLAALAGEWAVTVTAPGLDAPVGAGAATLELLHGGRFLRLNVTLELDGQQVGLTGHLGHDGISGEWQALWLSDLSTGMALLQGDGDLDRGVHLIGEQGGVRGRSVVRVSSPDAFRIEAHGPGPNGRDRLLRTSEYVRK